MFVWNRHNNFACVSAIHEVFVFYILLPQRGSFGFRMKVQKGAFFSDLH